MSEKLTIEYRMQNARYNVKCKNTVATVDKAITEMQSFQESRSEALAFAPQEIFRYYFSLRMGLAQYHDEAPTLRAARTLMENWVAAHTPDPPVEGRFASWLKAVRMFFDVFRGEKR